MYQSKFRLSFVTLYRILIQAKSKQIQLFCTFYFSLNHHNSLNYKNLRFLEMYFSFLCPYTVVYAMLDASADTNFFKITHSFIGNVTELAQNYEANNYKYDEIEVKFTGKFEGGSTQTLTLDTISKWIPYDPTSVFYSGCYQTYYYTTKKLIEGEEYKLEVLRKADGVVISSKVNTINNFKYKKPIENMTVTFTDVTTSTTTLEWNPIRVRNIFICSEVVF